MVVPAPSRGVLPVRWRSASLSDVGRRRERNEDALLDRADLGLYAVADGMGGHAAGDVASRIAVETLASSYAAQPASAPAAAAASRLATCFAAANDAILGHAAAHPDCSGMGTTLTALVPLAGTTECVLAHVGDSRAYRLRDGELQQLTRDHTWVQQQVDAGMLTPRAARSHRLASVLNRVIGTADLEVDTHVFDAAAGDLYLLCSDGLSNMVGPADLRAMLLRDVPLARRAQDLVDAANLRGGFDNITVLLLQPETA